MGGAGSRAGSRAGGFEAKRRRIAIGALTIALFLPAVALAAWMASVGFGSFLDVDEFDRTGSWGSFYRESVAPVFKLPEEGRVVSAREGQALFQGFVEVRLRLPNDRTPESWLKMIADDSGLEGYRLSKFEFDAGWWGSRKLGKEPRMDECFLKYDPSSGLFVARYGWD